MKKMLFVYNPNSGKMQINDSLSEIIQIFSAADYEVTIYPTKAQMDGYAKIKENDGVYDIVVCSGGDGTLNETVAAVMEYKGDKPFIGYIPSGTTNDFARSLGISNNMVQAAKDIVEGEAKGCDIGMFNGRYYNYVAAFGAFTEVSYATPQEYKNVLGHQAYVLEGLKSIPFIKPSRLTVECDGETVEGDFIYGMVTNTMSVGGFKNIAGRNVKLDDGLFECTFIRKFEAISDFNKLLTAILNKDAKNPNYFHVKTNHIVIHSEEEMPWVLDGEFGGNHKDVEINIIGNAVNILVPAKAPEET
ncbi:MAG: YegS/Rv2252/BmrU family lipid kinase [Alistipes sp.]|nr:YegS/Rv2252/BmrU family lipid kinase [Alistipes sp.]